MDPKVAKADAKHEKLHSQKRKKDSSERKTGNEIFDKINQVLTAALDEFRQLSNIQLKKILVSGKPERRL